MSTHKAICVVSHNWTMPITCITPIISGNVSTFNKQSRKIMIHNAHKIILSIFDVQNTYKNSTQNHIKEELPTNCSYQSSIPAEQSSPL